METNKKHNNKNDILDFLDFLDIFLLIITPKILIIDILKYSR